MLTQPTIEKLISMKLTAMAKAFANQMQCPDMTQLSFEERFGLIVDYQMTDLENRRMQNRLKNAKLRLSACIEDLDFKQSRGMDRSVVMSLAGNQWVKSHHNIRLPVRPAPAKVTWPVHWRRKLVGMATLFFIKEYRVCFRISGCQGMTVATTSS